MKTLKFSSILCIVLSFFYFNAKAQNPLVELHDNFIYTIDPSPDLPCLSESISFDIAVDGFFTNSSFEAGVYNYTYHEKGEGKNTGVNAGEYEMGWNYNSKNMSFNDGFQKHITGMALSTVRHNGKIFMTIKWQYHQIWTEPWTNPIVWYEIWEPKCK